MCCVARSSARKRRSVAAMTVAAKSAGSLRPAAASTSREHVGGPAAGEIARNNIRRQREAGAHELLRYNGGGQRLAVDEHAVAVEDDHGSPDA